MPPSTSVNSTGPPASSGKGRTANYALKNKALILSHMEGQKRTWVDSSEVAASSESSIRVFVRVRPLHVGSGDPDPELFSVVDTQAPRTLHVSQLSIQALRARVATRTFEADGVLAPDASNEDLWDKVGMDGVLLRGMKGEGSMFYICAYGQTGSGKTFSTTYLEQRLCRTLFENAELNVQKVSLSAFEIRGGECFDLLSDPPFGTVKIQGARVESFPGLTTHDKTDVSGLLHLVEQAASLRTTRSTLKNDTSSRSHSVMQYIIHYADSRTPMTICILDLAGSERASTASANSDRERQREAIQINAALAALKECIRARLVGQQHVPWRQSKLTMVLRHAFGDVQDKDVPEEATNGTSQLVVLACVSPSIADVDDTIGTMNYISPFQLAGKDAVDALQLVDVNTSSGGHPRLWSHEQSVDYIRRNFPKLAPLIPRIFKNNESTLATVLLPLSTPAELTALISTISEGEDPRVIAQAKASAATYHAKLHRLVEAADRPRQRATQSKARAMGATRSDALATLSGRVLGANISAETSVGWDGTAMSSIGYSATSAFDIKDVKGAGT